MPRLPRRLSLAARLVCVASLLAACQVSGPGGGGSANPPSNSVTGGEIEVTPLEALPGAPEAAPEAMPATAASGAETAAPQAKPGPQAATPEATEAAVPAPKPDLAETPVTPKSEQQLACEKKHGTWAGIGKGKARACVFSTRDAGKQCTRESQCEGVCLARSGTCSPIKPLFGCNEILQDNGARVTLCLD